MMEVKDEIQLNRDNYIRELCDLLKINTILDPTTIANDAPFGAGCEQAIEYFLDKAKKDGFVVENSDNYAGHVEYGNSESETLVGILAHLDVVPVSDDWSHDPFDPLIKDGKIYARGAMDDKGPLMATYIALRMIKERGIKLKNKLRFIVGCNEETGWECLNHYFKHYPLPAFGISPDADFPVINGEKGILSVYLNSEYLYDDEVVSFTGGERLNIVIPKAKAVMKNDHYIEFNQYLKDHNLKGSRVKVGDFYEYEIVGKAAHAMEPEKGINAGIHMANFLQQFTRNKMIKFIAKAFTDDVNLEYFNFDYSHPEMGIVTNNVGIIKIDQTTCNLSLNIRYPIGFSVKDFIDTLNKIGFEFGVFVDNYTDNIPHYVESNSELVQGLYDIYVKHTGDSVNKPFSIGGGTYARILPKGVAFGMEMPGDETVAHITDEYLKIDAFLKGIEIYYDALIFLGNLDA